MKRITAIFLSMILLSSYSYAGTVENISLLLDQIGAALRTTPAPQADLLRAEQRLQQVLGLVQGAPGPVPTPIPRPDYKQLSCVARDNDNSNPWVIGIKDLQTLSITKIAGTLFTSRPNCEASVAQSKRVFQTQLFCVSRDNDGNNPFILLAFKENADSLRINNFKSVTDCYDMLVKMKVLGTVALFCGARDNDGVAPFQQFSYNSETHQLNKGAETFQRLEDCYAGLK